MWGEALRQRRNPSSDCFMIRDRTGIVLMEVPFAEVLESTRGARPEPSPPQTRSSNYEVTELALARGREIVARQRNLIERLKSKGRDAGRAEELLGLFTDCLRQFEQTKKRQSDGVPPPSRQMRRTLALRAQ